MTVFSRNWLRTSFRKQLLGKYISPELDPDPAVKIPDPDPAKRSGSRIPKTAHLHTQQPSNRQDGIDNSLYT
jgi:hypothetical protein